MPPKTGKTNLTQNFLTCYFGLLTNYKIYAHITTYNVGGMEPPIVLEKWVYNDVDRRNPPDLVVFGCV
jgi:hypothetical protein